MTEDFDSAFVFLSMALERAKASEAVEDYTGLLINLADLEKARGNYGHGLQLLDSAFVLAERIKSIEHQANTQQTRAQVYAAKSDYKNAFKYLSEYLTLREQILNEEKIRSVTEMMEKYESEKKARQIQQLELEKLDATLTNERITNTRNRYLFIGIAVLLIALALWGRLRYVHRARAAIQREKDISEGLLLNILPAAVADELKTKGYAEAKYFAPVTILFSDFKGFTTISEELSAAELVEELNACFKTFDDIMTRYGIEKIKTIGDSYMAAGNIPDTNTSTPVDVVNAGLDMQEFVTSRKKDRDVRNLPAFDMRVGIHSGPVVAGIVGVKKFQYDLWGDTVNTASRMETNGEINKVNISEATYQLVKDNESFSFTPRGMINVKGKGALAMYFVERVL
jgi:class 3 adenylate cyclase